MIWSRLLSNRHRRCVWIEWVLIGHVGPGIQKIPQIFPCWLLILFAASPISAFLPLLEAPFFGCCIIASSVHQVGLNSFLLFLQVARFVPRIMLPLARLLPVSAVAEPTTRLHVKQALLFTDLRQLDMEEFASALIVQAGVPLKVLAWLWLFLVRYLDVRLLRMGEATSLLLLFARGQCFFFRPFLLCLIIVLIIVTV